MKDIIPAISPTLPERHLIKTYPKENWLVIGHLTHAKPTTAETQLRHFKEMMHELGYPNRVFGRRLHWLVRVGGPDEHIHLHFLLGRHQLTNGHKHSYQPEEVISFLKNTWKRHGMGMIALFDLSRPGIEYVLRREPDHCHNEVAMSEGLTSVLKKAQRVERDPLALEIINHLRSQGVKAGFGDEMQAIRGGAI